MLKLCVKLFQHVDICCVFGIFCCPQVAKKTNQCCFKLRFKSQLFFISNALICTHHHITNKFVDDYFVIVAITDWI